MAHARPTPLHIIIPRAGRAGRRNFEETEGIATGETEEGTELR